MKAVFKHARFALPRFAGVTFALVAVMFLFADFVPAEVVKNSSARAKMANAQTGVRLVAAKASLYFADTAQYPNSIGDLLGNSRQLSGWRGPYFSELQSMDPWNAAYIIRTPGLHSVVDVISLGADGLVGGAGTNADIENWPCK